MEVHWLLPEDAIRINSRVILETTPNEPIGIRDQGLLDSALQRGNQVRYYVQTSDVFDMAAAIGFGVIKNHPFLNANKRTAFVVVVDFLLLNGFWLSVDHASAISMCEAIAKGEKTETCLAAWLRCNSAETQAF